MRKVVWLLSVTLLMMFSCKKERQANDVVKSENPRFVYDNYGRVIILHGLNMSSSAKAEGNPHDTLTYLKHNPWTTENFVDQEAKEYGFNAVRYLIFWDGIEPIKDYFRDAYLDSVEVRIKW